MQPIKLWGDEYITVRNSLYVHDQSRKFDYLDVFFPSLICSDRFKKANTDFLIVDHQRIKQVGPDIACAEWLLKNGASVRFKGNRDLLSDYNKLMNLESLPESSYYRLEEVYAKDVSLTENGFEHFKNCNKILKITFINCPLDDQALIKLAYVKNSLEYLEMQSCAYIGDAGLLSLAQLSNLKILTLVNLHSVKKKAECEIVLRKALPKCQIEFH